jgi:hypothetical protein
MKRGTYEPKKEHQEKIKLFLKKITLKNDINYGEVKLVSIKID